MDAGRKNCGGAPAQTVRHLNAGPAALAALRRLLGLSADWSVLSFCLHGCEEIRFALSTGGRRLDFEARAVSGSDRAQLWSTTVEHARLVQALERRLAAGGFAGLRVLLEADPDRLEERLVEGREGDAVAVPCIGQPIALLDDGWRNFYADQDFEVLLGVPEIAAAGAVAVKYADLECHYSRPKRSFRKWTFLDWPEVGLDEDPRRAAPGNVVVAELEERDMILGTGERAEALVAEVKKLSLEGRPLVFEHLCTPIVMGDDMQGLAKRCEKECGAGASVRWSQKDRDDNDNFGAHMRSLFARPGFMDGEGEPDAVNLFHFPMIARDRELVPFLEELGLRVEVRAFPDVDVSDFERLGKARWQVFCRRSSYPTKLRALLEAAGRPVLEAPAPYGWDGGRACLEAIAAATGRLSRFEETWAKRAPPLLEERERQRRLAEGLRLGFVVSQATLPRLLDLRFGHGAPLAPLARELGFGLDLLYFDRHGRSPALPPGLEDAGLTVFRGPWELARALEAGRFQAVYSDVVFDRRISRAGKGRFSSRDLEMGFAGAARSGRRLVEACRLDFYRRYGGHLRRGRLP